MPVLKRAAVFMATVLLPLTAYAADPEEAPAAPTFETSPRFIHTCRASVNYSWTEVIEEGPDESDVNKAAGKKPVRIEEKKPRDPITRKVFFRTFSTEEEKEEQARITLARTLIEGQSEASLSCQREHENTALCVQRKLQASDGDYHLADYQTRQVILQSIKKDCQLQRGICAEPVSSEITCEKRQAGEKYKKIEAPAEEEGKKKKKK